MLTWYIIESFLEEREKEIEYTRITKTNYISKKHCEFFYSTPKMLTCYIIESFLEEREKEIECTRITKKNYISKMGDHFTNISSYITLLIIKA